MNVKVLTYLPHIFYFFLLGVLLLILRWTVCPFDTGGGMNFTPFLQGFLLFIGILAYLICDLSLRRMDFRIFSQFILFGFLAWSYRHYFKMQELNEYCSGHPAPPYDSLTTPPIGNFVVLWIVCQGVLFYLCVCTTVSYLFSRKKSLTNRDKA